MLWQIVEKNDPNILQVFPSRDSQFLFPLKLGMATWLPLATGMLTNVTAEASTCDWGFLSLAACGTQAHCEEAQDSLFGC